MEGVSICTRGCFLQFPPNVACFKRCLNSHEQSFVKDIRRGKVGKISLVSKSPPAQLRSNFVIRAMLKECAFLVLLCEGCNKRVPFCFVLCKLLIHSTLRKQTLGFKSTSYLDDSFLKCQWTGTGFLRTVCDAECMWPMRAILR